MQDKDYLNIADFYRLGKLMHYMADSFTYPHNEDFDGSIKDHIIYEYKFHKMMKSEIVNSSKNTQDFGRLMSVRDIKRLHDEYDLEDGTLENDHTYIFVIAKMLRNFIQMHENVDLVLEPEMKISIG